MTPPPLLKAFKEVQQGPWVNPASLVSPPPPRPQVGTSWVHSRSEIVLNGKRQLKVITEFIPNGGSLPISSLSPPTASTPLLCQSQPRASFRCTSTVPWSKTGNHPGPPSLGLPSLPFADVVVSNWSLYKTQPIYFNAFYLSAIF